jgi:hypothetical protein
MEHPFTVFASTFPGGRPALQRELKIGAGTLHNLLTGRRKPSRSLAVRIVELSRGRVPFNAWDSYE